MKEGLVGEFGRVAEILAARLEELGEMSVDDIADVINGAYGSANLYPSKQKGSCERVAFFVSLQSRKQGRRHLNFNGMLACFVQHMQGHCPGITRHAVLITDCWDGVAYDDWRANVERVKLDATVEAYLINGSSVTPFPI